MLILGLTGSIGMGKSTTAKLFTEAGVPVYDADATVHRIYEGEAAPAIEAAFPGTTVNGKVDRARLSERVMHDPAAIRRLEAIVHPMLRSHHQKFLEEAEKSGAPVAVMDIPLLYETAAERNFDLVIVTACSRKSQKERLVSGRNLSEALAEQVINAQIALEIKIQRADRVVWTDCPPGVAALQVNQMAREIIDRYGGAAN